jgi:large subunit ribosomal protein L35Ae
MVKGIVVQFRRGRHRIHERHYLLDLGLSSREQAKKMSGKEVSWKSSGKNPKEIKGKISDAHGNNGLVRAIFEKGLPGQAMTTEINVAGDLPKAEEKKEEKKKDIENKKEEKETKKEDKKEVKEGKK